MELSSILLPFERLQHHAREWGVTILNTFETESSLIGLGTRDAVTSGRGEDQSVVLKIVKRSCDEWHSGEILDAFAGNGFVRCYEHVPGAVLTERLLPGNALTDLTLNDRDREATEILADVILQMSTHTSALPREELPQTCPTVADWANSFDRYLVTGDQQIPASMIEAGQHVFRNLCASQRRPQLLHGDLQHYNVLYDSKRGWLAIDPKGVVGEVEYEVGAFLRNPCEEPELFLSRATVDRRLKQLTEKLRLDFERALGWSFAQAVLSAIWMVEDGFAVEAQNPTLQLAEIIRPAIKSLS